jgi:hypothetical protein
MPLASATDYATIGGWNLAGQFAKHRDQLVDAAQLGYKLLAASGIPPQAVDCEDAVRVHIHGSADFDIMMQAAQISYDFVIWDMLAGCLARILLDEEFHAISH